MMENEDLPPSIQYPAQNEVILDGLTFSSKFDSGNMLSVHKGRMVDALNWEYIITAAPDASRPDTPPEAPMSSTTWFYFSILGISAGQEIALKIVNLIKHTSLYDQGMRPVVRTLPSQKKWERLRQNITHQYEDGQFSIQFNYTMLLPGETVYIAFCYPYSYSDLQRTLRRLELEYGPESKDKLRPKSTSNRTQQPVYFHRETLVLSLDGRKVDLLTISSYDNILDDRERIIPGLFPYNCDESPRPYQFQNKKIIFVTARVHPAETPSSFVLDGVIKFLLKDDPRAQKLLKECVFKIIPMLNPDGVARGHYRHDPLGANLNRHYLAPNMAEHPTIFATKAAILATCTTRCKLTLHVDLHAHAVKRGCFIYGNRYKTVQDQVASQVYPRLIGLNSVYFEYDQCNFSEENMHLLEKRDRGLSKDGCARVALFNETQGFTADSPIYFYTLECNYNMGRRVQTIPPSASGSVSRVPLSPGIPRKTYTPKYTTSSWEDVGKGMMVAVLDHLGSNEWSRIPQSSWRTLAGLIQDIRSEISPIFTSIKTNSIKIKSNTRTKSKENQDEIEMKRYGYVGLPPATSRRELKVKTIGLK